MRLRCTGDIISSSFRRRDGPLEHTDDRKRIAKHKATRAQRKVGSKKVVVLVRFRNLSCVCFES